MTETKSEALFKKYCIQLGVSIEKIDETSKKTADYRLVKNDRVCIAEVKEFTPNNDEKKSIKSLEETGVGTPVGGKPGERVRNKIKSAMPQFKRLTEGRFPCLIVLYYNVPELLGDGCASAYDILTAMYGLQMVSSVQNMGNFPDKFGGGRQARPDANTTLSAIMVIRDFSGNISASLYHNKYAKVELPVDYFFYESCNQFKHESDSENYQQFVLVKDEFA